MLRTVLFWFVVSFAHGWEVVVKNDPKNPTTCLTGYMTDVQTWVTSDGQLTNYTISPYSSIDLSEVKTSDHSIVDVVRRLMTESKAVRGIKAISFAKSGLSKVPWVFHLRGRQNHSLYDTLEYMSFYGNDFDDGPNNGSSNGNNGPGSSTAGYGGSGYNNYNGLFNDLSNVSTWHWKPGCWASGFSQLYFYKLRELDLRKCSIQVLDDNYFRGMRRLEALYLGENRITQITDKAFSGLQSLIHLDVSRNADYRSETTIDLDSTAFGGLTELASLDFSFSKLEKRSCLFENLGRKLRRLSMCYTSVSRLQSGIFRNTSIAYLDLSGNTGILDDPTIISGLEKTLKVLYADSIDLRDLDIFNIFHKIEVLRLRNNEIVTLLPRNLALLKKIQVLDLDDNRIAMWLNPIISKSPTLKLLSIRRNNLNLISQVMMRDIENLPYLAIASNSIVCNCYSRELYEIAYRNENNKSNEYLGPIPFQNDDPYAFSGYQYYNDLLKHRKPLEKICDKKHPCNPDADSFESEGKYVLIDYDEEAYKCLSAEGSMNNYLGLATCKYVPRFEDIEDALNKGWARLWALIIIPIVVFPTLIFLFVFRKNLRYFCVMVKNTATLSWINNDEVIDDDNSVFNYDVFVSYCNEDRDWVLDHLLPHLEQDYNVNVCLHERDFQVGLSILENIVSCMDRSKSIMLVLSRRFLLSQWCQFEMHLAQHRLLETRREDLILILLEEIPRGIRPTTLHYLMLTKTYVVWSESETDRDQFWRRLKRSLIARRLIHSENENVSLA